MPRFHKGIFLLYSCEVEINYINQKDSHEHCYIDANSIEEAKQFALENIKDIKRIISAYIIFGVQHVPNS